MPSATSKGLLAGEPDCSLSARNGYALMLRSVALLWTVVALLVAVVTAVLPCTGTILHPFPSGIAWWLWLMMTASPTLRPTSVHVLGSLAVPAWALAQSALRASQSHITLMLVLMVRWWLCWWLWW